MSNTEYTLDQIIRNNGEDGNKLWMLLAGNVYDVTEYALTHPGGAEVFMESFGEDRIEEFDSIGHSPAAVLEMKRYLIGKLKKEEKKEEEEDSDCSLKKKNDDIESKPKTTSSSMKYLIPATVFTIIAVYGVCKVFLK